MKTAIGKALKILLDHIRDILAVLIVIFSFGFLFKLSVKEVPTANQAVLNTATGLVLAGLGGVVGYYFGSSKGESDAKKDQS